MFAFEIYIHENAFFLFSTQIFVGGKLTSNPSYFPSRDYTGKIGKYFYLQYLFFVSFLYT